MIETMNDFERPPAPWPIRAFNALGPTLDRVGALLPGKFEGGQGVLRGIRRGPAVRDDQRAGLEQGHHHQQGGEECRQDGSDHFTRASSLR